MNHFALNLALGIIAIGIGIGFLASGSLAGLIAIIGSIGVWYDVGKEISVKHLNPMVDQVE